MKVSINIDDLMKKVRAGEVDVGETWNLYFDIIEKKPEKQEAGKSTHYMVHSKYVRDWQQQNRSQGDELPDVSEDLPF